MNIDKNHKLLIIGGISYSDSNLPRLGGTTILMDNFIEYCVQNSIPYILVPTNRFWGFKFCSLINTLFTFWMILVNILKCNVVMVNISSLKGTIILLPFVAVISKLTFRDYVFRMFAGNLHVFLESNYIYKKIVYLCIKKSKHTFVETYELINYFKSNNLSVQWFPNVRIPVDYHKNPLRFERKCVFMSHVKKEKGMDDLISLKKIMPECEIDVYGKIVENTYSYDTFKEIGINYMGELLPNQVRKKLIDYDILLLPSYREGYPGIIIEALSVGLPCISTRVGGVPEVITDGYNGKLVEVGDVNGFKEAIQSISKDNYSLYSNNAKDSFNSCYNSEIVNKRIVSMIIN